MRSHTVAAEAPLAATELDRDPVAPAMAALVGHGNLLAADHDTALLHGMGELRVSREQQPTVIVEWLSG